MHLLKLSIVTLFAILLPCAADHKKLLSTVSKLTSRRKRSLLLPKSGSIKLTIGIGKSLIGNTPKGLSLSWEISNYYSGPTAIKDWLGSVPQTPVQKLRQDTTMYQNLLNPMRPGFKAYSTPHKDYKDLTAKEINTYTEVLHQISKRSEKSNKTVLSEWMNDDQSYSTSPLEGILNILLGTDVKCCILRSICGSKQFLLPPGYSMIQDLVRTMFLSSMSEMPSDEVTIDLCDNTSYCELENNNGRTFNFLDWILNPKKVVF